MDGSTFYGNVRVNYNLQHFGILGMHWGKRKSGGSLTSSVKKKATSRVPSSDDHKKKMLLKSKKVHELSNDQLRELASRLQLEKQFKDLNPNHVQKGLKIVKNVTAAGTTLASLYTFSKTPMAQATFKAIKKAVITATLAAKIR